MPSFSLFQNAPEAEFIPRLPTFLLPSGVPPTATAPSSLPVCGLSDGRGSLRCCIMVVVTMNLYLGGASLEEDSEMSCWRILPMMALFQAWV